MRQSLTGCISPCDRAADRLQPVVKPVQPGGDHSGEGEVEVRVGSGNPVLQAERRPMSDYAEGDRPSVETPGVGSRSKCRDVQPLIGIYVRTEEKHQVAGERHLAAEPVASNLPERAGILGIAHEAATSGRVPDAEVDVTG